MAKKSWLIVGSVPKVDFPLILAPFTLTPDCKLSSGDLSLKIVRGTPTLIASAILTKQTLTNDAYFSALLVGDTGSGEGSHKLYAKLCTDLKSSTSWSGLTFHYLYPDVDWQNRILLALDNVSLKPCLVADAGFMYAAKMSGYAGQYDLFTPDLGELAFLADEQAPHPFYTRGFLLDTNQSVPDLIARAYEHTNAAKWLIVKGASDTIVHHGEIVTTINSPNVPAMEAIGGTGDLVTGVVTGLLAAGLDLEKACPLAARVARIAGKLAKPNPATQIAAILPHIPLALEECLQN